jgi:hypothetical protein
VSLLQFLDETIRWYRQLVVARQSFSSQMQGLFRQISGSSLIWHEIVLTFAADSDYRVVAS